MQNVLILVRPDQVNDNGEFRKTLEPIGELVTELSILYSTLKERSVELILIAEDFPGINPGIIRKIRMRAPQADILEIARSGYDRSSDQVDISDGFIDISEGSEEVSKKIKKVLAQKELLRKFGIIGLSEKTKLVATTIERIAPTDISVLIVGPSGAGKELVARAIHDNSSRTAKRFVAVNCGALAEGVLESELFGHEKGAFTGSVGKREGLFKQADGGTIFLDEIGETKPDIQVKLLRVLEDGVFYPVGGDTPVRSDVRVIAATNRDLNEAINDGVFREDLYFRLGVVKIMLPPLHDRKEDIIPLLYYFGEKERLKGFSERAIDLLLRYDWPGNVRQLRNFISRVAALKGKTEVGVQDVEQFIHEQGVGSRNLPVATGHTPEEAGHELIYHALIQLGNEIKMLKDLIIANLPSSKEYEAGDRDLESGRISRTGTLAEVERELIDSVLKETEGNRKEAARRLGMGERTLYRKLKKYNLT
jgi:DNA-binding NtrC family response regulator